MNRKKLEVRLFEAVLPARVIRTGRGINLSIGPFIHGFIRNMATPLNVSLLIILVVRIMSGQIRVESISVIGVTGRSYASHIIEDTTVICLLYNEKEKMLELQNYLRHRLNRLGNFMLRGIIASDG